MLRGFRRGVLIVAAGLMVLSPLLTTLTPAVASATQENPLDQLERWFYYRGMRACLNNPDFAPNTPAYDNGTRSISDINNGHILPKDATGGGQPKKGFGYLGADMDGGNDNDGTVECTDGSIFYRGARAFGFDEVINLICAMNNAVDELGDGGRIDPKRDGGNCEDAQEVEFDGGGGSIFQEALTKALENPTASEYGGDGDRPDITLSQNGSSTYSWRALYYLLGKNSLETFCGGAINSAKPTDNYKDDEYDVSVYVVRGSDGKLQKSDKGPDGFSHSYTITKSDRKENSKVDDVYYKSGNSGDNADDVTCAEMATLTRENAKDYAAWAENNVDLAKSNDDKSPARSLTGDPNNPGEETTCAIDGIGWIVCPVMTFLATINDKAFGFLEGLLGIRPALIRDEGTISAWSTFRDFANVMFVIAFMVIVYSQLTSAGVSNYGLKKMLPKVVVAAILVNLSYFICAIMVDISNIAGSSIYSLMDTIGQEAVRGGDKVGGAGNTWSDIVGGILVAGVGVLLVVALVMAPTVLLALAVVLLILIARQALVIILIIASPLAFVAYLLPNTEDWFKRWWKAFVATLMVYPIVGLVFGGSMLVSNILMGIAGDGGDGGDDEQLLKLVALGVMAIPLFAVPAILKGSLSAMGSIGTKIAGFSNKADGYAKNKAMQGRLGEAKAAFNTRRQARKINRRVGDGVSGRINQRLDQSRLGRYIGGDRGSAAAVAAQQKMTKDQIDNSISLLQNGDAATLVPRAVAQLQEANRRGDAVAARAATQVLTTQTGARGIQEFHNAVRGMEAAGGLHAGVSENIRADVSAAGLKGKDRALDTWSRQEGGMTDLVQHDANQNLTSGLNEAELAGQSAAQLANFAQTGSMTQAQAQRVLAAHDRGAIQLDEAKLGIFTNRANSTEPLRVQDAGVARQMADREVIDRAHEEALYENTLRNNEQNNPSTPRDNQ